METKEIVLRKTCPIFINSFNQPTYLCNIVEKLCLANFSNIYILDNSSSSPEILDYYKFLKKECKKVFILYYNENMGPRYFHLSGIYKEIGMGEIPHLYTDPDIDFDFLAEDFLSQLLNLTEKYQTPKAGCALEIPTEKEVRSDLICTPPHLGGQSFGIIEWENQYWKNIIETDIYDAPIDTTLHLFNPKYFSYTNPVNYLTGIRVAKKGFVVKHRPWYKDDFVSEKEVNFYRQLGKLHNTWIEKR